MYFILSSYYTSITKAAKLFKNFRRTNTLKKLLQIDFDYATMASVYIDAKQIGE